MKIAWISLVVIALLLAGTFGVMALNKQSPTQTTSGCGSCNGSCTAEKSCGLAGCGATTGGSCSCGKASSGCGSCNGSCTAEKSCGLAGCGATTGGSCSCGKA